MPSAVHAVDWACNVPGNTTDHTVSSIDKAYCRRRDIPTVVHSIHCKIRTMPCIYNNIVPASGKKRQRRVSVPARPQYGNAAVRERRTGFRFRKTSRRPFAAVLPCKRNPPQRYERAQAEDSCRETERKPMKEPPPAASIRPIRRTGRVRKGIRRHCPRHGGRRRQDYCGTKTYVTVPEWRPGADGSTSERDLSTLAESTSPFRLTTISTTTVPPPEHL